MRSIITPALVSTIRAQFRLDWQGVHGAPHWARVLHHGLYIASSNGADLEVVAAFAFVHDSRREDEWEDPGHGERAAEFAAWLRRRRLLALDRSQLALLQEACRGHSDGTTATDPTLQACWDADRLDLARVGTTPHPRYLSTAAAKDPSVIQRAVDWAIPSRRRSGRGRPGWYTDEDGVVRLGNF